MCQRKYKIFIWLVLYFSIYIYLVFLSMQQMNYMSLQSESFGFFLPNDPVIFNCINCINHTFRNKNRILCKIIKNKATIWPLVFPLCSKCCIMLCHLKSCCCILHLNTCMHTHTHTDLSAFPWAFNGPDRTAVWTGCGWRGAESAGNQHSARTAALGYYAVI